jgi:hypothetical protein
MVAQVFMLDWLWNVKRWTLKKKIQGKEKHEKTKIK